MPETRMLNKYTKEEIIAALKVAKVKGATATSKETGISLATIKSWAKRAGVGLLKDVPTPRAWDEIRAALD
jgi:hypothetical protein